MNPSPMSESLAPKPPPRGIDLPFDDGEPLESSRHFEQMALLIHTLRHAWRDRHDFYVAGNMFLYFSETQSRRNDFRGPDVFVVLDTDDHARRSWVVWEEDGKLPAVVIELTSESTEAVDRGKKKTIYGRTLRIPFYVVYDPFSARLDAFGLDFETLEYQPVAPDARGYVRCGPLGLWLGVVPSRHQGNDAPWLRWIDDAGEIVRSAEERAEAESARAASESARAQAAEAELERLRGELARRGP